MPCKPKSFLMRVDFRERGLSGVLKTKVWYTLRSKNFAFPRFTSEEQRREPRKTNSELVRSHDQENVPLDLTIRILNFTLKHNSMKLGTLIQRIQVGGRGYCAVMALLAVISWNWTSTLTCLARRHS